MTAGDGIRVGLKNLFSDYNEKTKLLTFQLEELHPSFFQLLELYGPYKTGWVFYYSFTLTINNTSILWY